MSDALVDAEAPAAPPPPPSITIDGRRIEVKPGELLIAAAERGGTYIPRFCYHPRMEPVGMCRMCLVQVDGPRGPALVVSCMQPVADGMVVSTEAPNVKKAQEGVLEFLLVNHPLDCPVCDKGGECPLQDQTISNGPGESRFVEEKRHYEKPIAISELVQLDRERCILCDRCTRFAKDVAGDPLIHFTNRGGNTQVETFPNHPFASYFSGNTVQICPVGALTASPYRFKARPWDLEEVESTCTSCSVGCRVTVQSSRNQLLRYQGVDSDPVNWGWLCDKGRFDFEAVNSDSRLGSPRLRRGGELVEVGWSEALDAAGALIARAIEQGGPTSVAVIGGARGTNEDAYAWAKLAKGVIGTDHVDAQLGDGLPVGVLTGLPQATIDEACQATTVVLLAPDLKEELPVLYLRLRDAAEHRRVRIVELSSMASGLTPYTWATLRHRPGEQSALVRAILGNGDKNVVGASGEQLDAVRAQLDAGPVVVVVGRTSLAESPDFAVDATSALRDALPNATFLPVLRRGNVRGALLAGLTPGLLPGFTARVEPSAALTAAWSTVPDDDGLDTTAILEAAAAGRIRCLILLGADPASDHPNRELARRALAGAGSVIAIDTFLTASSQHADVVLAAAGYGEKSGTTTNLEGRVSAVSAKVSPIGTARSDWAIAADLAERLGADLGFDELVDVQTELRAVVAALAHVTDEALVSAPDGVLAGGPATSRTLQGKHVEPPLANAYAYRLTVSRTLYDAGLGVARSHSLAGLARGSALHLHPTDAERLGVASGTEVKVVVVADDPDRVRTAVMTLVADADVARGVAWAPFNQPGDTVGDLLDGSVVVDVRVETL